ncbi:hypothetical protein ABXS69_04355 [Actinomyces timonensis]|uniref:Uncharacterized protein n=1 Tax=Actinomyces timonensis TaxID=1288391 RepID=A0AAU8N5I7_9ACTO
MTNNRAFTEAEQAYYDQLDEDVTAGRVQRVGSVHHRDGSAISDDELDALATAGAPASGTTTSIAHALNLDLTIDMAAAS